MKTFLRLFLSVAFFLYVIIPNAGAQGISCATAVAVSPGTYTADGPSSGGGASNVCFSGATNADWYSYTPTADGTIDISACNGGADTRLSVHTGSCGSLSCLDSNDDACDTGTGAPYASELTNISVTAGTTYYIEWDDKWDPSGFTWTLTFTPLPACPAPSSQTASNITASSAELNWTQSGNPGSWDIEWGPSGFTQGSGTLISGIASHPYTLSGLSPATTYDWYVRANCSNTGDGFSSWTGPQTFTTACSGTTSVPYSTDFTSNPPCWSIVDNNGDGNSWAWSSSYGCAGGNFSTSNFLNPGVLDEWLFSPDFNLTGGTDYFFQCNTQAEAFPSPSSPMRIYLTDSPNPTSNKILLFDGTDLSSFICLPANSTFTAPSGWAGYYIAFHSHGTSSDYGVIIDDFSIETAPSPSSLVISEASPNTCYTYDFAGVAGNGWHHVYHDQTGEILFSINSEGQILDRLTLTRDDYTTTLTLTDASTGASKKLMSRIFEIKSTNTPANPIMIRLYQTNQELTDMNNSSAGSGMSSFSASDLDVTNYFHSSNQACVVSDNQADGSVTVKIDNTAITPVNVSNGFYLEFQLNHMIEFFAHEPSTGPLSNGTFLPLELIAFNAEARDAYNLITWTTANEEKPHLFLLERSANGTDPWQEITKLESPGKPDTQQYRAQDEDPLPLSYYRLRMTDPDGRQIFSPVRAVLRPDLPKGIFYLRPNPVAETLFINITMPKPNSAELYLYDTSGQLIKSLKTHLKTEQTEIKWDVHELAPGPYFVKVKTSLWSQSAMFFK